MSYETIRLATDGAIATIQLNRPERMNAVIEEMYRDIGHALEQIEATPELRCIIITGSVLERDGDQKQAFCAGADLKKHSSGDRSQEEKEDYIRLAHDTVRRIYTFPKPIIAAVNGPARGAGTEMALACDFILMANEATLALPETGLGTFVGGGVTHILPLLVGPARAKELVFTGKVIDGHKAVELGLALECHPVAKLQEAAKTLALEIADKAPLSVRFAKHLLQHSPHVDIENALELETKAILTCMESDDWQEGLHAFSEKRKPSFVGR